jgi:hypothetical protein
MTTLRIKRSDWERFATSSLEGLLMGAGLHPNDDVTLEIEQTSLAWRTEHGGPDLLLVPEYVPMCILESVIKLIGMGCKVSIVEITEHPHD